MSHRLLLILLPVLILGSLLQASFALAQSGRRTDLSNQPPQIDTKPSTNQPPTNNPLEPKTIIPFDRPVTGDLATFLNHLTNLLFGLIASVAVIFIVIGGFRLAFSQGNTEAVTTAKKTITWAILGLVIALLAFAIVRIVINLLYR